MNIARLMRVYRSPDPNPAGDPNPENPPAPAPKGGDGKEELLADLQKWKQKARDLEKANEDRKRQELEQTNQYKSLYEQEKSKREEVETHNKKLNESYINERKFSALREECQKMGLRPEALSDLELLDLGQIKVETTSTGKINILGAKDFAERVKTLKPHYFGGTPPNVNTKLPKTIEGSELTEDAIYELEKEGRKSGDMSKYKEAVLKFQKRQR